MYLHEDKQAFIDMISTVAHNTQTETVIEYDMELSSESDIESDSELD